MAILKGSVRPFYPASKIKKSGITMVIFNVMAKVNGSICIQIDVPCHNQGCRPYKKSIHYNNKTRHGTTVKVVHSQ